MDPAAAPGAPSVYREAATFVALGGVIILLAHAVEVTAGGGPNWVALAIRVAWFAVLLLVAGMLRSGSRQRARAGAAIGIAASAVLDVAILWVTGRSASPLLLFTPVLATVLPFVSFEAIWIGLAGSAALVAGTALVLAADGAAPGAYLALVNAGGGAMACGWLPGRALERARRTETRRREELAEAMASIRTLTGLLPVCSWCHRVRSDAGYWERLETYIASHSDARFTHGLCQECATEHFADFLDGPAGPVREPALPPRHGGAAGAG